MIDERMKLLAGQRLVAGFEGYTVPESFQKLIRDCKIGNVILFRRNIQSAEQLRELCVFLHCLIRMETGLPPMILLDEEGKVIWAKQYPNSELPDMEEVLRAIAEN